MLFFSATLHTDEVRRAIDALTERPTWVDLKGKATIPDTVHALVCSFEISDVSVLRRRRRREQASRFHHKRARYIYLRMTCDWARLQKVYKGHL